MTVFAYLRVSTEKQTIENQRNRIQELGFHIDSWFQDEATSGTTEALKRNGLAAMLTEAKSGDTIIAVEISRLGRNTTDVLNLIELLRQREIKLRIVNLDGIDLTSSMGKLILTVMIGCSQFERDLLVERTKAGIARTVSEGTVLGKLEKLSPAALADIKQGKLTHTQYAEKYGVSTKSIQRAMKKCVVEYEKKFEKKVVQHKLRDNVA